MRKWLRKLRGALGMGLTWAAAWVPVGALVGVFVGVNVGNMPLLGWALNYAQMFGVLGFAGGAVFSTLIGLGEGRRRFDQLSLTRFTGWGALGGALLGTASIAASLLGLGPTLLGAVVVGVSTLMGAASAAGSLVLARLADDKDLLTAAAETGRVGLTADEERRLLED